MKERNWQTLIDQMVKCDCVSVVRGSLVWFTRSAVVIESVNRSATQRILCMHCPLNNLRRIDCVAHKRQNHQKMAQVIQIPFYEQQQQQHGGKNMNTKPSLYHDNGRQLDLMSILFKYEYVTTNSTKECG